MPGRTASTAPPCLVQSILDVPEFRPCVWSHPGDTYTIHYRTSGPLLKHVPGGGGGGNGDFLGPGECPWEETGKRPDCGGCLVVCNGAAVVLSLGKWGVDGDDILMMEQLMSVVAARRFLVKLEAARKKSSDVLSLVAALLRAAG